jgi:hypothetical protein
MVSTYGARKDVCTVLVGKRERRRPLEKPRHRWKDNIKMDIREVGWAWSESFLLTIGIGGRLL